MTVALNSVSPSTTSQSYVPTVAPTAASRLATQAVSLSAQSAVVASLGGATGATVYSPAGLLNSLAQAGSAQESLNVPADGSNADTSNAAQDALNQGIVSSLGGSASASGVYSGAGTVSPLSDQASSNWADLLKTNPNLASTVIGYSYAAGIVSTLQVTA